MPMEQVEGSRRGSRLYAYDNYLYRVDKVNKGRKQYRCRVKTCMGRALNHNNTIHVTRAHNHQEEDIVRLQLLSTLKQRAHDTPVNTSCKTIFDEVCAGHPAGDRVTFGEVEQSMYRARRCHEHHTVCPLQKGKIGLNGNRDFDSLRNYDKHILNSVETDADASADILLPVDLTPKLSSKEKDKHTSSVHPNVLIHEATTSLNAIEENSIKVGIETSKVAKKRKIKIVQPDISSTGDSQNILILRTNCYGALTDLTNQIGQIKSPHLLALVLQTISDLTIQSSKIARLLEIEPTALGVNESTQTSSVQTVVVSKQTGQNISPNSSVDISDLREMSNITDQLVYLTTPPKLNLIGPRPGLLSSEIGQISEVLPLAESSCPNDTNFQADVTVSDLSHVSGQIEAKPVSMFPETFHPFDLSNSFSENSRVNNVSDQKCEYDNETLSDSHHILSEQISPFS